MAFWAFQWLTRNRLSTARVRNADELLDQLRMLGVVPVSEDNRKFFVVLEFLLWWVDNYWCAKTIDVLSLRAEK